MTPDTFAAIQHDLNVMKALYFAQISILVAGLVALGFCWWRQR